MLSRALSLATVMLLVGCFAAAPAWAQATNLEAGKSPAQIFNGTCTACHKSPRGLLKTVPPGSLQSFLRQHYTTSPDMASLLTAFLISNGAADTRAAGAQARPGKEAKSEARTATPPEQLDRFGHRLRPAPQEAGRPEPEPREAARPDADGRHGRNAKRLERPGEAPAAEGQTPVQAAIERERGPEGRKWSAREKLNKRGKAGEEPPKAEAAKEEPAKEEPAKGEAAKEDASKSETAKVESSKPEAAGPTGEGKSETAKIEVPKEPGSGETPTLRADPVPPVTPAPAASPAVSAAVSGATPEPASLPSAPTPVTPTPAVTASAPAPVAPAGPPAPPISQ